MEKFFTFIGVFIFSSIFALLLLNHYDSKQKQKFIGHIRSGNVEAIKDDLKNHDMAANTVDPKNGYSFLHYAVIGGHEKMIRYLIDQGAYVNIATANGQTPLHFAVKFHKDRDYMKTISILLEKGADVNKRGSAKYYKNSPLDEAIREKLSDVVELLLEQDLSQETLDQAMYYAAGKTVHGGASLTKTLIQMGANPTIEAFHRAATADDVESMKMLIDAGADIYALDKRKKSALYKAAMGSKYKSVKFLLDIGAYKNEENDILDATVWLPFYYRKNPKLHLDRYMKTLNIVFSYYKENGISYDHAVMNTARRGHLEGLKFLLKNGADIQYRDEEGQSILHKAISNMQDDILDFILEKGIDPNVTDKVGKTPLMIAAEWIKIDSVEKLLQAGANINAQDKDGLSALHHVAPYRGDDSQPHDGDVDMIRFLLESGADPSLKTKDEKTALDMVAGFNKRKKEKLLKSFQSSQPEQTDP